MKCKVKNLMQPELGLEEDNINFQQKIKEQKDEELYRYAEATLRRLSYKNTENSKIRVSISNHESGFKLI
ncbi:MAG: hypothetical protein KAS17_04595 [Victivallaceae bacterium]|nr:hypothetical protein [Victivallaceae bacterium]